MTDDKNPAEFSRPIDLRYLEEGPLTLTASPEECAALARRFALVAVHALEAELVVARQGTRVLANGRLRARIVQSCAVSAEDLPVTIDEAMALAFVPEAELAAPVPDEEIELDEADCDLIPFAGSRIDLGEAVAQSLALAIDPFLTGPEAETVRASGLLGAEEESPFAALKGLNLKK